MLVWCGVVQVHFENNSPFAVVEQLEREIEVSHWGNVYVTEHYKMRNGGAKHKGTFSRSAPWPMHESHNYHKTVFLLRMIPQTVC